MRRPTSRRSPSQFRKKPNAGSRVWRGYYDIVIIPPASVQGYAIDLSRQLRRLGGNWSLGRRRFIPHISLYHIPVQKADFDSFIAELRNVARIPAGELKLTGFDMPVLTVSKPRWLANLHWNVVRRTSQYFDANYGAEETWGLDFFSGH